MRFEYALVSHAANVTKYKRQLQKNKFTSLILEKFFYYSCENIIIPYLSYELFEYYVTSYTDANYVVHRINYEAN